MKKDFKPKWAPITEVPVIPVHEDMGGRDEPDQHPISAITGLEDALDGKADKVFGKGLSTEDYTSEEKAKLEGIESGAEVNRIMSVWLDMRPLAPDAQRSINLDVYTKAQSVRTASLDPSTGVLTLKSGSGETISTVATPLGTIITAASYDAVNRRVDLTKADGTHFYVNLQDAITPYVGGDTMFTSQDEDGHIVFDVSPSLTSALDNTVRLTGNQSVAGSKNFTGTLASSGTVAGLTLQSAKATTDSGQATGVFHYLSDGNGGYALTAYDDIYLQSSRIVKRMKLTGRSGTSQTLGIVANDDGTGYAVAPSYLPSDGSGGTAAPSDGTAVITQAMLAANPTVVHTTGDEAIAGTKDFTGTLRSSGSIGTLSLRSSKSKSDTGQVTIVRQSVTEDGADSLVGYDDIYLQSTRVTKRIKAVGRDGTEKTMTLVAADDGTGWATAPSYLPDDGSGGVAAPSDTGTVITQAMLAASPTVAHRAGDESIAGAKTFTGTLKAEGAVDDLFVATDVATTETQAWCEVYHTKAGTASRKNVIAVWLSYEDGTGGGVVTVRRGYRDALLSEFGGEWSYGGTSGQSIAVVRDTTGSETIYKIYAKATTEKGIVARRVMEHDDGGQYGAIIPSSDWERGDGHAVSIPSGTGITVKQIDWS